MADGRIHEADAEQLEQIKLALELSELLGSNKLETSGIDADQLANALKGVVTDLVAAMPKVVHTPGLGEGWPPSGPARPSMKHTNLTSIAHKDSDLSISQGDK